MAATLGPGRKLCVHAYGIPYVKRGNEISSGCRTTLNDAFMMTARRTPGWTTQSSREVGTRERVCLKSFSWELGIPVRIFTFKGNKLSCGTCSTGSAMWAIHSSRNSLAHTRARAHARHKEGDDMPRWYRSKNADRLTLSSHDSVD